MADAKHLLHSINTLLSGLSAEDHETSEKLLFQIDKLRLAIETPMQTAFRIGYQPWQHSAVRVSIELNLFGLLVQAGEQSVDVATFVRHTGADSILIVRLLRMLIALGLCSGSPMEGYKANSKTAIFTMPEGRDSFKIWADLSAPTAQSLCRYFHKRGYNNPYTPTDSAFASVFGDEFWTWKSQNAHHSATFDSFMASRRTGRPLWFDLYPTRERLLQDIDDKSTALIDIGGNRGHDIIKFRDRFPEYSGRLILQDLPEVLSKIEDRPQGIEIMNHDFFTPQPVKGARAYLYRSIFHDWPTAACHNILKHTAEAMVLGYSKLLICDFILDDAAPDVFSTSLDLQMMGLHCGMERSEAQWNEMLESAGLKISSVFRRSASMEAVIEAELSPDLLASSQAAK